MSHLHEVQKPIINSPYREPTQHYYIKPGEPAKLVDGRRQASYYYRPPERQTGGGPADEIGTEESLVLVNTLRERVKAWRESGYPGVTRTTLELLKYWRRDERVLNLFFCQIEAVETIIFLKEARADMRQGLEIVKDIPAESDQKNNGYTTLSRYACKMATGSGKTIVMAMIAAWSILNKVNDRSDALFSDLILAVCPNVTIRDRLGELDPQKGEASIYRKFDLVPHHLMEKLRQGKVGITNWHIFEPQQGNKAGKASGRVVKKGVETDNALVRRVFKQVFGSVAVGRQNILVLNDEAHHAYRLKAEEDGDAEDEDNGNGSEADAKTATVWISGLDKINKLRNINFCVDLSATPYYLSRTGNDPGRPFPWVISDFGLIEAIEAGLVKIPQLPIQDTTGTPIPAYFNVWKWIRDEKLTAGEKGGKRGKINLKAVLKYAQPPIAQLAGLWRDKFREWQANPEVHPSPPVFIIVCRDTTLARYMHEWIGEGKGDTPHPIDEFLNRDGQELTVRVDSKVVTELETGIQSDESQRIRFILQTIGKQEWPSKKIPEDWQSLCEKLNRKAMEEGGNLIDSSIPPGRDIRCIISVAMLTEGWDANTVTHIIGLRPFMSQLLCEQVVGRGLRRTNYRVGDDGLFVEEEAKVYGVPFEVIPFKTNPQAAPPPPPKLWHVLSLPEREHLKIEFPRIESYSYAIKNNITVDWGSVPSLQLDPLKIPPEVTVKGLSWTSERIPSLTGPGKVDWIDLKPWRREKRVQELEYALAQKLTHAFCQTPQCEVPAHVLFRQMLGIVKKYVSEKVKPAEGFMRQDVFINPFFSTAIETLRDNIRPDAGAGEAAEIPIYDPRGEGSTADVDFWTSKEVREVSKSHLNRVVLDTKIWEQTAAFYLDQHEHVQSFVKNAGLEFAIPYMMNNERKEYIPDFIIKLQKNGKVIGHLILEIKGAKDEKVEIKASAAKRWVNAVNNDGRYGIWDYQIAYSPMSVKKIVDEVVDGLYGLGNV